MNNNNYGNVDDKYTHMTDAELQVEVDATLYDLFYGSRRIFMTDVSIEAHEIDNHVNDLPF